LSNRGMTIVNKSNPTETPLHQILQNPFLGTLPIRNHDNKIKLNYFFLNTYYS